MNNNKKRILYTQNNNTKKQQNKDNNTLQRTQKTKPTKRKRDAEGEKEEKVRGGGIN